MQQVDCVFNHCSTGTFSVTGLQEPQFSFLHGEFHILHIMIMVFQLCLQFVQLPIDFRHGFFHWRIFGDAVFFWNTSTFRPTLRTNLRDLLRCTDTSHHVFALCVDQVFTIEEVFSVTGITRETYTGSGSIAHIAEHHSLYADSRAPFGRNPFHLTIEDSTFVHPAVKHSTNGAPKLFIGGSREILTSLSLDSHFEFSDQCFQILHIQFIVKLHSFRFLDFFDNCFKWIDIFLVGRFHTQHDVSVHLYETAIWIPCKPRIVRLTA